MCTQKPPMAGVLKESTKFYMAYYLNSNSIATLYFLKYFGKRSLESKGEKSSTGSLKNTIRIE